MASNCPWQNFYIGGFHLHLFPFIFILVNSYFNPTVKLYMTKEYKSQPDQWYFKILTRPFLVFKAFWKLKKSKCCKIIILSKSIKQLKASRHQRRKCEGSSSNSLRPLSYFGSIWELYILDLNTNFFEGKITNYTFPWTRDSQYQNSGNRLAGNTPNASKIFSPICLPKPKSFDFFKKKALSGCPWSVGK